MILTKYFEKIIKRQKEIGYSFPESLNPPADIKEIRKIESNLEIKFTNPLEELYLFANGSLAKSDNKAEDCLMPLYRLLSLTEALEYYNRYIKDDYIFDTLFENWQTKEIPGKKLFPFLADDSHCFWIDLNDSTKNYGRIYSAVYGGESPEYQFNSLINLFQVILECYEKDIFFLDKGDNFLMDDLVRYGELCHQLNPDIEYWKIVAENWRKHSLNE